MERPLVCPIPIVAGWPDGAKMDAEAAWAIETRPIACSISCSLSNLSTDRRSAMWVRQCELDAQADCPLPIPSRIASNEEFIPPEQTPEQRRYEARLTEISDAAASAQGMDRRTFLRTGSGMAAALLALN